MTSTKSEESTNRAIEQKIEQENYPWRSESILRELYVSRGLSQRAVSERLGCNSATVGRWMEQLGIPARDHSDNPWHDESTLREMYVQKEMTVREMAADFGCGIQTVSKWLRRNGIDTRGRGRGEPGVDESTLRRLYVDEKLSTNAIGDRLGHASTTIQSWLRRYDIPLRSRGGHGTAGATYYTNAEGYQLWTETVGGKTVSVYVHQLAAIAGGAEAEEVFSDGTHCHHRAVDCAITWPSMLDVLSTGEHRRTHTENKWTEENGIPVLVTQRDDGE